MVADPHVAFTLEFNNWIAGCGVFGTVNGVAFGPLFSNGTSIDVNVFAPFDGDNITAALNVTAEGCSFSLGQTKVSYSTTTPCTRPTQSYSLGGNATRAQSHSHSHSESHKSDSHSKSHKSHKPRTHSDSTRKTHSDSTRKTHSTEEEPQPLALQVAPLRLQVAPLARAPHAESLAPLTLKIAPFRVALQVALALQVAPLRVARQDALAL